MGIFSKLFGGEPRQSVPDDYLLASKIASTIDGFMAAQGLQALLNPKTAIGLSHDYRVFLSRAIDVVRQKQNIRAAVFLKDLRSFPEFKSTMEDPLMGATPFARIATDQLATEVLKNFKSQID